LEVTYHVPRVQNPATPRISRLDCGGIALAILAINDSRNESVLVSGGQNPKTATR
jgi:hypothetical protein